MCELCSWSKVSQVLSLAQFPHQCSWVSSCRWQSDLVFLKYSFRCSLNSCRVRSLTGRISCVSQGGQGGVSSNLEIQKTSAVTGSCPLTPSTGKVTIPQPVSEQLWEKGLFPLETIWKLVSSEFSLALLGVSLNSKAVRCFWTWCFCQQDLVSGSLACQGS